MEVSVTSVLVAGAVSIVAAILSEGVNWYLIYRHDEYKKLLKDI